MTMATAAFVISLLSMLIALTSLAWNIWSKFIYPKAKLEITCGVKVVVSNVIEDEVFEITMVNHGPTDTKITHCCVSEEDLDGRKSVGLINPLHMYPSLKRHSVGPFGGGLPKDLKIGESFTLYFPYEEGIKFITKDLDRFFIVDVFGKRHYCKKKDAQEVKRRYFRDVEQKNFKFRSIYYDGTVGTFGELERLQPESDIDPNR